jgi:hypothetical protein
MSRRQIAFVVIALASFAVSACGVGSSTAPRRDDTTSIVGSGSGG